MKKAIALTFILLANIILLAHAVIPHHEHDNMLICLFDSHCGEYDATHSDSDCDHHHNQACSDRCCLIDNIFDPSDNKEKTICQMPLRYDCQHPLYLLTSNSLALQVLFDNTLLLFLFAPFIDTCHIDFISQSLGLRAPPC